MNRIGAVVTGIETHDGLTVVTFDASGEPMRMMALELQRPLEQGQGVRLGVKASNIAVAKSLEGELSISNRLPVVVERIERGELLASVIVDFHGTPVESIITRDSCDRMQLQPGDSVTALVKASELSILEVEA
jgi:molybdopterin-binding protein